MPSQFEINIELVKRGVKKAHLWYPPKDNLKLSPPAAPKGITKLKTPYLWLNGIIYVNTKDALKIRKEIKKAKKTKTIKEKDILLGEILGYMYPCELLTGIDGWWVKFSIQDIGLVWAELIPVRYNQKNLNNLYTSFKKVVNDIDPTFVPKLVLVRGPFEFGTPYVTKN
jgi:hypothetical protein